MSIEAILNEIQNEARTNGNRCAVSPTIRNLPPDAAEGYAVAIDRTRAQGAAIARALRRRGATLGQHSIQRHRRDQCDCIRDLLPPEDGAGA